MGAGFQCFNDGGYIQIDENYKNLALVNKAVMTPTTAQNAGIPQAQLYGCSWITYSTRSKSNVICLWSTQEVAIFLARDEGGPGYTYKIMCGLQQVEVYEFGPAPLESATNAGFQVFNPSGELVFSGDFAYMRVLDFAYNGNTPSVEGDGIITRTYPNVTKVGMVLPLGLADNYSYQYWTGEWVNGYWTPCHGFITGGVKMFAARYGFEQITYVAGSDLGEGNFSILMINLDGL